MENKLTPNSLQKKINSKRNLVYGLKDPRNDVYFYIGKTTTSLRRPISHLTNSHNKDVNLLVKEIIDEGLNVVVSVIEDNLELNNLSNREKYWINYYYNINEFLLNKIGFTPDRDELKSINNIKEEILCNILDGLEKVGETIKSFRLKRNLTQESLSKLSNLSRGTIHSIERGKAITTDNVIKILVVLKEFTKEKGVTNKVRYQ